MFSISLAKPMRQKMQFSILKQIFFEIESSSPNISYIITKNIFGIRDNSVI